MLVLSRRQNDSIVFPNLGITVQVVRISGSTVRIGVKAPDGITVLRHEIAEDMGHELPSTGFRFPTKELSHRARNRLNSAMLALHLLQKQLDLGRTADAMKTLDKALLELASLDSKSEDAAAKEAKSVRALLVEDDANESELLAGFLQASGFSVDTADDGCKAIDYLSCHARPDVVLLDMHMPRCNGPATISAIRGNPQLEGLKIFAVSGSEPSECGVSVGPHGADRWFSKPIDPRRLVGQINADFRGLN